MYIEKRMQNMVQIGAIYIGFKAKLLEKKEKYKTSNMKKNKNRLAFRPSGVLDPSTFLASCF